MKLLILISLFAFSFVPAGTVILDRLSAQHGKGRFELELDVLLKNTDQEVRLREVWWIQDESALSVRSYLNKNLVFEAQYTQERRVTSNSSVSFSKEFFEPDFVARSRSFYQKRLQLIGLNVQAPPPIKNLKDWSYSKDPNVTLARLDGVVTYLISEPNSKEEKHHVGYWIQQDVFHLRKIRFPTQSEVFAENYVTYSNQLQYPRDRTLTWDSSRAEIRTLNFRTTQKDMPALSGVNPLKDQPNLLVDFYKRFR